MVLINFTIIAYSIPYGYYLHVMKFNRYMQQCLSQQAFRSLLTKLISIDYSASKQTTSRSRRYTGIKTSFRSSNIN